MGTQFSGIERLEDRRMLSAAPVAEFRPHFEFSPAAYALSPREIATDRAGNLYVLSPYNSRTDFNPSPRRRYRLPENYGYAVAKYTPGGRLLWARGLEAADLDGAELSALAVSSTGSVFVSGFAWGSADLDPTAGRQMTSGARVRFVVVKLNPDGVFVYGTAFEPEGDHGYGSLTDLAVDGSGNAIVTGNYTTYVNGVQAAKGFAVKLDEHGEVMWNRRVGGTISWTVAAQADGHIVVLGSGGEHGALSITKLNRRGRVVWERIAGGDAQDQWAVAIDRDGNIFGTASFGSRFELQTPTGSVLLNKAGYLQDSVVFKMNSAGGLVWARQLWASYAAFSRSIALDKAGYVRVAGLFRGNMDLDPAPDQSTVVEATEADVQVFSVALNQRGLFAGGQAWGNPRVPEGNACVAGSASGVVYAQSFTWEATSARGTRRYPAVLRIFSDKEVLA